MFFINTSPQRPHGILDSLLVHSTIRLDSKLSNVLTRRVQYGSLIGAVTQIGFLFSSKHLKKQSDFGQTERRTDKQTTRHCDVECHMQAS